MMSETSDEKSHKSTLSTRNLRKRYKKRTVVADVSVEVGSGEVVGLLGPNGAGKTTCFYMVVGLVACDGGDVYIDDKKITHLPIHQRAKLGVSYLPQEASVFRKLTVMENIKAENEYQQKQLGKTPQAGIYTLDFVADGAMAKAFDTRDCKSLEWLFDFSAADSGTVIVEYLDTLGNL